MRVVSVGLGQQIALVYESFLSIGGSPRPAPRWLTFEDVLLRGGWFQVFEEVVRLLHAVILQVEDYLNYSKTIFIFRASRPPSRKGRVVNGHTAKVSNN